MTSKKSIADQITLAAARAAISNVIIPPAPVIEIFYEGGRWRLECKTAPVLNASSVTLWSLFNLIRDRISMDVEREIKSAPVAVSGKSLLHRANEELPPGCYCKPGQCMAPRPSWCRDGAKRDAPIDDLRP